MAGLVTSFLFISGPEIAFILFIVVMVFGADKIPSIARGLAKGMTQVRRATNEIKTEIQKSADVDDPSKQVTKVFEDQVKDVKNDINELTDSIKRKI